MESAFRDPELKLIETFLWDGAQYVRLPCHLARMGASAGALRFPFDPGTLPLPANPGPRALRCRLTLDRRGRFEWTTAPLPPSKPQWSLAVASEHVSPADPRLLHKTTDRALYDRTRAALPMGVDEVIFLNERGEVAEGTITNLFFDLGAGLMTPPLASGCLPGCLRAELLESGAAREAVLGKADLSRARLWVGNSLRGLIPAALGSPRSAPRSGGNALQAGSAEGRPSFRAGS